MRGPPPGPAAATGTSWSFSSPSVPTSSSSDATPFASIAAYFGGISHSKSFMRSTTLGLLVGVASGACVSAEAARCDPTPLCLWARTLEGHASNRGWRGNLSGMLPLAAKRRFGAKRGPTYWELLSVLSAGHTENARRLENGVAGYAIVQRRLLSGQGRPGGLGARSQLLCACIYIKSYTVNGSELRTQSQSCIVSRFANW
mmetsp:Transcript_6393/g.12982  ORF Transcript_6393/g.12982 Transcript_6393/m.12982 type:complete len:201 (+) Transcript_6393:831-1433(+)